MVRIINLIMLGIATVCALTLTFIVLEFVEDKVRSKFSKKKRNRVHFYVARDMDGRLYLYLGKPIRGNCEFHGNHENAFTLTDKFRSFGLNKSDYKNLHWKDEPLEVFLNVED